MKVHKSIGPDKTHTQVLRELAVQVAKPVSIIFDIPLKFPLTGKEKKPKFLKREIRKTHKTTCQVSLSSVSVKIMEEILLETLQKHMANKEVIDNNQHRQYFTDFISLKANCA